MELVLYAVCMLGNIYFDSEPAGEGGVPTSMCTFTTQQCIPFTKREAGSHLE